MTTRPIQSIKMFVMDVDGTLTDGKVYMGNNGEIMKAFDIKDGYAIHDLLPQNGIIPVWVTTRESEIVSIRATELGVKMVYQGVRNKLALLNNIASDLGYPMAAIAYIGDDVGDIACMKACGYSGCPQDAAEEVKNCVAYVAQRNGGSGAVREFIVHVIRRNNEGAREC